MKVTVRKLTDKQVVKINNGNDYVVKHWMRPLRKKLKGSRPLLFMASPRNEMISLIVAKYGTPLRQVTTKDVIYLDFQMDDEGNGPGAMWWVPNSGKDKNELNLIVTGKDGASPINTKGFGMSGFVVAVASVGYCTMAGLRSWGNNQLLALPYIDLGLGRLICTRDEEMNGSGAIMAMTHDGKNIGGLPQINH